MSMIDVDDSDAAKMSIRMTLAIDDLVGCKVLHYTHVPGQIVLQIK